MSTRDSDANARLLRLGQLINEPLIRANLPEGYYENITEDLELIQSKGMDAVHQETLESLIDLVDEYESWLAKYANQPPVFASARAGDLAEVLRAVDAGFDANAKDMDGLTLLMQAASGGHADVVTELISRGADISTVCEQRDDIDAMMMACANGHVPVIQKLLERGAPINKRYTLDSAHGLLGNQTLLSVAASRGHVDICRVLVDNGADLDVKTDSGYTALMSALVNGASEAAAELLLDAGADPDPSTVPVAAVSDYSTSPLILAATNGFFRIVLKLIKLNVRLDLQDAAGWTALKHASRIGREDIVGALIDAGADVNIADEEGWTPLIAASSTASWGAMELLINAGADVNATADDGVTALREVVARRLLRHDIVFLAELSGNDLDPKEAEGYAMAFKFVEKLLHAGASVDVAFDEDGEVRLIDEVEEQGDDALHELLLKFSSASRSAAGEV